MNINKFNKSSGMSLVELMIAVALGIIITGGLIEIFINNKLTYRVQDGLARLQENGRYAHYYLSKEIRMAGYGSCGSLKTLVPAIQAKVVPPNFAFSIDDVITGHDGNADGTWSPALPPTLATVVAPGTDVIGLHSASRYSVTLKKPMVQPNVALIVEDRIDIQQDDVILICDSDTADIFFVTNVMNAESISHGSNGNWTPNLSKAYQTDARVMKIESSVFYLKDTGRVNITGQPILALVFQDLNGVESELVEGVEEMQITYGVDSSGDLVADTYQTATTIDAANNWANVMSVRLSLLLNTIEEVNPQQQQFTYNGNTATPGDRMLRRQWDYFITLRNRTL